MNTPCPTVSRLFATLLLSLGAHAAASAQSDALKMDGAWIDGLQVLEVEGGEMTVILPNGAEVTRDFGAVEGMRLARYPRLAEATEAVEEGDDRAAVRLFDRVLNQAREDWVKQWATHQLVGALDRQGDPRAVDLYLQLAVARVPFGWLESPPVASASRATDEQKRAIQAQITAARERAGDEVSFELDTLADAAAVSDAAPTGDGGTTEADPATPRTGTGGANTDWTQGGSAVPIPSFIEDTRDLTLLRRGRFNEAREMLDTELTRGDSDRSLAERLFLHGHALLGIAEGTGDEDDFRKAAMSFMRVAIYFPRHSLAMYALLEAAYCHQQFGAEDDAESLYRAYQGLGGIDADNEPAYGERAAAVAEAIGVS